MLVTPVATQPAPEGPPVLERAFGAYDEMPRNELLGAYLDEEAQRDFVNSMLEVQAGKYEVVIRRGEEGNNFFIIKEGECECLGEDGTVLRTLRAGGACGELAIIHGVRRTIEVIASTDVKLLLMHRSYFSDRLGRMIKAKRERLVPFLRSLPILTSLDEYEIQMLADVAVERSYRHDEMIIPAGHDVRALFVVLSGAVSGGGAVRQRGQHFGAVELFTRRAAEDDLVAAAQGTKCIAFTYEQLVAHVSLNAFMYEAAQQAYALGQGDGRAADEPGHARAAAAADGGQSGMRARRMGESAEPTTSAKNRPRGAAANDDRVGASASPASKARKWRPGAPPQSQQRARKLFISACRRVLAFRRLEEAQLEQLFHTMAEHEVEKDTVVIVEGEPGSRFYFVESGELDAFSGSVTTNNGLVRSFGPGDSFGELALMYDCPRSATVVARSRCVLWSLDRATFKSLVLAENLRKATMYEKFLDKVPLFEPLSRAERNRIIDALEPVSYSKGSVIIREGDVGNAFYLIEGGTVHVHSSKHGRVASRTVGDYFGERSLHTGDRTIANVLAGTDCKLVRMEGEAFRRILGPIASRNDDDAALSAQHASGSPPPEPRSSPLGSRFGGAAPPERAGAFVPGHGIGLRSYDVLTGKEVASPPARKEGSPGGGKSGSPDAPVGSPASSPAAPARAHATKAGGGVAAVAQVIRNAAAGRREHKEREKPAAQQQKQPPGGGRVVEVDAPSAAAAARDPSPPRRRPGPLDANGGVSALDFEVLSAGLGEGGFGKVLLGRHTRTKQTYALKQMSKAHLIRMDQAEHVVQESALLAELRHPFIANKLGSFSTDAHLFLVLELAPGGDMYDTLDRCGGTFVPADARVFVAQMLLALEHLHARSIIHRDLKLENMLVGAGGEAKLTDFGFAKRVDIRTWTLCGTPEYLAPELILDKGHNKGVDYWALGVVMYEMLVGCSPFIGKDHMATYHKILNNKVYCPPSVPPSAAHLISKLLEKDISKRFGVLKHGTRDIKQHGFFKGYDWADLSQRASVKPKIHPRAYDDADDEASAKRWMPLTHTHDIARGSTCPIMPDDELRFDGF